MIKEGTWVMITQTILGPTERSSHLPDDTKAVPFRARIKGFTQHDAAIGDVVTVLTVTGRFETGVLEVVEPYYAHGFGHYVDALEKVRKIIDSETEGR